MGAIKNLIIELAELAPSTAQKKIGAMRLNKAQKIQLLESVDETRKNFCAVHTTEGQKTKFQ